MRSVECRVKAPDGVELFYRAWLPEVRTDRGLILFHRGHEHSARWQETVEALALDDVAVFAWDARGHGNSPGDRGAAKSVAALVEDIDAFVRHVSEAHAIPIENMIVLGHSVGAVTLAAWVHDHAPPIRGLILATPAFRVKLYVPFAIPLLRLRQRLFGPGYVKSYVKAKVLTHDAEEARRYHADELIFRQIAVNVLLDLFDISRRLVADAGAIVAPTLMLIAGSDWVVRVSAQRRFFERLSSPIREIETYPGFYHAIFHEKDRGMVVERVRRFVRERFDRPPSTPSLLEADRRGYTCEEYDRLRAPDGMRWGIARLALKTFGRLSRGIELGWRTGFDSGVTLDYVYENRPRGTTPLGRLIDARYLASPGWSGIRVRRRHLEKLLREAIERTCAEGREVQVLDIAAGAGRYVLETLAGLRDLAATAVLRDCKEENLVAARRLAQELGLENVTIELGDAFDRRAIAETAPRPTVAIVSGLYELFPENGPIQESLGSLADALEPGSYLIYTNQPWHPQLEFIARVLTNREGQRWVMRRRTQMEMDELVRAAGFEKLRQEVDELGIFTVSLARRRT